MVWGAAIGAAGNILGGLIGNSGKKKEIAMQREFAQKGIQWKVDDAKAAGIHPLYALGAQTHSFQPVGLGEPLGQGLANAGQEMGRAISATQPAAERAYTAKLQALQLQRGELENQLLASQLARVNSPAQVGPPLPSLAPQENAWLVDGQAQSGPPTPQRFTGPSNHQTGDLLETQPMERTASDPAALHQEPGAINEVGWARTAGGGYAPVPSADVKERIEDNWIPQAAWAMRNMIGQNFSASRNRPPFPAPPGKHWSWSIPDQAYYLVNNERR